MSFFGTLFRSSILLTTIAASLAILGASIAALPASIAAQATDLANDVLAIVMRISMNRRLSALIAFVGGVLVTFGYVAYYETNFFLSAIDVLAAFVARGWQTFNVFVLLNARDFYVDLSFAWNTIWMYIVARGRLLVADVATIVDAFLLNFNFLSLFLLPRALWEFIYSLFFFATTGPIVLSSAAVVFADTAPYYYTQTTDGQDTSRYFFPGAGFSDYMERFDDTGFGAFGTQQSIPPPQDNAFLFSFNIGKIFLQDIFKVVGDFGRLVTDVAADARQPARLLAGNILLSVDQPNSTLRKLADLLTRVASLLVGTSFYPLVQPTPGPTPSGTTATFEQQFRPDVERTIARFLRLLMRILRVFLIYVNDLTTVTRATLESSDTAPLDGDTLTRLFSGFPVIDLVINGNRLLTKSLNILSSNYELCRINAIYFQMEFVNPQLNSQDQFSDTFLTDATPSAAQIQVAAARRNFHVRECVSFAPSVPSNMQTSAVSLFEATTLTIEDDDDDDNAGAGSGAPSNDWDVIDDNNCPKWSGETVITEQDRVDYIGELFDVLEAIVVFAQNPTGTTPIPDTELQQQKVIFDLVECVIDRLIHAIIYYVDLLSTSTSLQERFFEFDVGGLPFLIDKCYVNPLLPVWYYSLQGCVNFLWSDVVFRRDAQGDTLPCSYFYEGNEAEDGLASTEIGEANTFLCLIARLSDEFDGFFRTLCGFVDGGLAVGAISIIPPIANLRCAGKRKRSAPPAAAISAEARARQILREKSSGWSWRDLGIRAQLYAAKVASEVRKFGPAIVDQCSLEVQSGCSAAPLVESFLSCAATKADNATLLHKLMHDWSRSLVRATQMYDALSGCPDSDVHQYVHWAHKALSAVHSGLFRATEFTFDHSAAHTKCDEESEGNEAAYLRCAFESPHFNATFAETLDGAGGMCGLYLSNFGFARPSATQPAHAACMWLYAVGARNMARSNGTLADLHAFLRMDRLFHAFAGIRARNAEPPSVPIPALFLAGGVPQWTPSNTLRSWASAVHNNYGAVGGAMAVGAMYADMHDDLLMRAGDYEVDELDAKHRALKKKALHYLAHFSRANSTTAANFHANVTDGWQAKRQRREKPRVSGIFTSLMSTVAWTNEYRGVQFRSTSSSAFNGTLYDTRVALGDARYTVDWNNGVEPVVDGILLNRRRDRGMAELHQLAYTLRSGDIATLRNSRWLARHRLSVTTAKTAASVLGAALTIVNRRLRLEALPPVQALAVALEMLSGKHSADDLRAWSAGQQSFIVGEGFVGALRYKQYMETQQEERERWLYAYSLNVQPTDRNQGYLLGPADKTRTQDAHRGEFAAKAKQFLRRRRRGGLRKRQTASNGTSTQDQDVVTRTGIAITRFLGQEIDLAEFAEPFVEYGESAVEVLIDLADRFVSDPDGEILAPLRCRGEQDYRRDGLGAYRVGCIPFLSERALDWIERFPQSPAAEKGFFGWLESNGQIAWPAKLLLQECYFVREPSLLCSAGLETSQWFFLRSQLTAPSLSSLTADSIANSVCFVDYCQAEPTLPLCPVVDYCPQQYANLVDTGEYANGLDVLLAWLRAVRSYILFIWDTASAFNRFVVVAFFLVYALGQDVLPLASLLALIIPVAHVLFTQQPAVLFFPLLPLYTIFEILPLLAYFIAVAGVALPILEPPLAINALAVRDVLLKILPDFWVAALLRALPVFQAEVAPLATQLEQNVTDTSLTLGDFLCAILSTVKLLEWLALLALILVSAYVLLKLLRPFLDVAIAAVRAAISILLALFTFRRGQLTARIAGDVADAQEKIEDAEAEAFQNRLAIAELSDEALLAAEMSSRKKNK